MLMTAKEQAVAEVMSAYNQPLNSSDTEAVMPLYAQDGSYAAVQPVGSWFGRDSQNV
jgi:ketosteroid isomerase-like protein